MHKKKKGLKRMRTEPMNFFEEEDYDVSSTAAVMSTPETGSPNVSKSKMTTEHFQWNKRSNQEDDDSISYFGVEVKKRSATKDRNPWARKKSKASWEGKQIIAAAIDYDDESYQREKMFLSMRRDAQYAQIMEEKFRLLDSCTNLSEMGRSILQQLRQDYDLYDTNGQAVGDVVALKSK